MLGLRVHDRADRGYDYENNKRREPIRGLNCFNKPETRSQDERPNCSCFLDWMHVAENGREAFRDQTKGRRGETSVVGSADRFAALSAGSTTTAEA